MPHAGCSDGFFEKFEKFSDFSAALRVVCEPETVCMIKKEITESNAVDVEEFLTPFQIGSNEKVFVPFRIESVVGGIGQQVTDSLPHPKKTWIQRSELEGSGVISHPKKRWMENEKLKLVDASESENLLVEIVPPKRKRVSKSQPKRKSSRSEGSNEKFVTAIRKRSPRPLCVRFRQAVTELLRCYELAKFKYPLGELHSFVNELLPPLLNDSAYDAVEVDSNGEEILFDVLSE